MKGIYSEKDYVCPHCGYTLAECTDISSPQTLLFVPYETQELFRELNFKGWFTDSIDVGVFSDEGTKAEIKIVFETGSNAPTVFPDGWFVNDNRVYSQGKYGYSVSYYGKVWIAGEIDYAGDSVDRRQRYEQNKINKLQELLDWAKTLPENDCI